MNEEKIVSLLMEESSCDKETAELALAISDNNFEKALETISVLLKIIRIFKIKVLFKNKNIYGLIYIAINAKLSKILRFTATISQNPQIYEVSLNTDWFSFEKTIFSTRLSSGAIEEQTSKIEKDLAGYIKQAVEEMTTVSKDDIVQLLQLFFSPIEIAVEIDEETLSLAQFKKLSDYYDSNQNPSSSAEHNIGFLKLESLLIEDSNGTKIKKLKEGDMIFALITDTREIAQYTAYLLGAIENKAVIPSPVKISRISHTISNEYEIRFQFTQSIIGLAKVKSTAKLKLVNSNPWWKNLLSWKLSVL
ncbi:MAG: hypothetical protein LBU55_04730 [Elusimicrobiota bacterium]|jgi:hypothetical protein|nr:hypothetical protein [Elusimicrobiota bacterium]